MIAVVANGNISNREWLRHRLSRATTIVAADGGAKHIMACGLTPHVVIGDLDSLKKADTQLLAEKGTLIERFPEDKDETDLELALLHLNKLIQNKSGQRADTPIELYGAIGGRIDQTLANIMLLTHEEIRPLNITVREPFQKMWVIDRSITLQGQAGDKISLIPLTQDVGIKKTTNLKWGLNDQILQFGPARGVSNVMTAEEAEIEIIDGSGILVCIQTNRDWDR